MQQDSHCLVHILQQSWLVQLRSCAIQKPFDLLVLHPYVRLAMEVLPQDAAIRELRAEYKKAARCGDEVTAAAVGIEVSPLCRHHPFPHTPFHIPSTVLFPIPLFTLTLISI